MAPASPDHLAPRISGCIAMIICIVLRMFLQMLHTFPTFVRKATGSYNWAVHLWFSHKYHEDVSNTLQRIHYFEFAGLFKAGEMFYNTKKVMPRTFSLLSCHCGKMSLEQEGTVARIF